MMFTPDEKLKWEIEKLQAETHNLSRSFFRQPTFWIGLCPLILSLGTNLIQMNSAARNQQLAKIETESLRLEAKHLESQKAELEMAVQDQRAQLAQVGQELDQQQTALGALKAQISAAGVTREAMLRDIADLQQNAANIGGIVENTSRRLAMISSPERLSITRDPEKASQLERMAFEALIAGDFDKSQGLFQASEDAANGYHFSYEWSRMLRMRANDLKTSEGQRAVLQFALSKGYASYAPVAIRDRLRAMAK